MSSPLRSLSKLNPFHLAIPVHSVPQARHFYGNILGLEEGRRNKDLWQDYSLQGHQLVCHYVGEQYQAQDYFNPVDGDEVPVPHFGICLEIEQFHQLKDRLLSNKVEFVVQPHLRFQGQKGEQWTMFFRDQSRNSLEFKAMTHPSNLFAKYEAS